LDLNRMERIPSMTNFQLESRVECDIIKLLGIDPRKCWGLFDGKSSSLNGHQLIFGVKPNQHFDFMQYNIETGERSIDYALDGDVVAQVYQDTEKFQEWTPTAKAICAVPVLLATLQEIASGEAPFAPRTLAQAALEYLERI